MDQQAQARGGRCTLNSRHDRLNPLDRLRTLAQYDDLIARMGYEPGKAGAAHCLFRWATATPDGIQINDVWNSKRDFEQFASERIGSLAAQVGLPGPPEITLHKVHSYLTAG